MNKDKSPNLSLDIKWQWDFTYINHEPFYNIVEAYKNNEHIKNQKIQYIREI